MPKIVRCENCGKEAALEPIFGHTPATWIDITERMGSSLPDESLIVCSRACGAAVLAKPRTAAAPAMPLSPEPDIPF